MRFKNYINRYNKKNRIYSEEELLAMTLNDLLDNEPSIMAQDGDIGIPSYEELRQSPNTRWIDPYTNSQGQKDGGFFGSIPEYDESFFPKKKIEPFVFNPNPPYMMSMAEGEPEAEQEEESPTVLEGGVEENVYLPEEDESEPSVYIPDEEEPEERQKTPYELSDEDLTDILQNIIKAKTTINTQNEPIFEDNFPTLPKTDTPNTPPVLLPQFQTSLKQEELKEMWGKLLEKLRKMLRASNVYKNGTYISGASSINQNQRTSKADLLQGMFNDYKSLKDPGNTAAYVLGEFLTNYNNMKDADTKKADKYFHAKANYEAAQQGIVGSVVAKLISDIRELTDSYRNVHEKGYTPEFSKKDSEEDQKANSEGRRLGRKYPTKPPYEALEHLKPKGLPERYQKRW